MNNTLISLAVSVLVFSMNANAYSNKSKEDLWNAKSQLAVKNKLKDSGSAQFRNIYFHRGKDGIPMTCGEVNSKNSFGGYSGYQRFISAGSVENTYLEEEVSDFNQVWIIFCN